MDTVPGFQQFFGPVLEALKDEISPLTRQQVIEKAAGILRLSEAAREEMISSGLPRYVSNAGWACTYLKQAGCLNLPKRNTWEITERGRKLFEQNGYAIDLNTLALFPEYNEFMSRKGTRKGSAQPVASNNISDYTPDELLDNIVDDNLAGVASGVIMTPFQRL